MQLDKRFEGDYEYITSISKDEANDLLTVGQEFIKTVILYLEKHNHL
ncbi:hypothetical protein LCGC14_1050720 [marine sediment metagenome]|uniref:HEPN domain-containing protein n=1 Tax=marine sediment metagenome TaxID=412755 RepID=A0A0F9MNY9_9ZZZZ